MFDLLKKLWASRSSSKPTRADRRLMENTRDRLFVLGSMIDPGAVLRSFPDVVVKVYNNAEGWKVFHVFDLNERFIGTVSKGEITYSQTI